MWLALNLTTCLWGFATFLLGVAGLTAAAETVVSPDSIAGRRGNPPAGIFCGMQNGYGWSLRTAKGLRKARLLRECAPRRCTSAGRIGREILTMTAAVCLATGEMRFGMTEYCDQNRLRQENQRAERGKFKAAPMTSILYSFEI
jgi:hypothetical protein